MYRHNGIQAYRIEYGIFFEIIIRLLNPLRKMISVIRPQPNANAPNTTSEPTEIPNGNSIAIKINKERIIEDPKNIPHQNVEKK